MTRPRLIRDREPLARRDVFRARSRHGMEILVAPMPGFARTCAILASHFGSVDTRLPDGRTLPAGTAHFLEHEMFQKADGDVFTVYDARGAAGNAYTTWSNTAYVFTCSSDWERNLETLLGAVSRLEIDQDDVLRERRIIGQEIAMYDDDPSWRGYLHLLQALYVDHPVRQDIAGTASSIEGIDLDLLRGVHATWYAPRNLVLAVAGRVLPDRVLAVADACVHPGVRGARYRRVPAREPRGVRRREVRAVLPISRPTVWLGLKDVPPRPGRALVERQVLTGLVLETLFDDGGRIQSALYDEGVIDDSFHATYEAEGGVAHAVVSAEVDDVDAFRRRLTRHLRDAVTAGITEAEVERARRRALGGRLRMLNGPEPFARWLVAGALERVGLDAAVAALGRASARRVTRRLRELAARPRAWAIMEAPATALTGAHQVGPPPTGSPR